MHTLDDQMLQQLTEFRHELHQIAELSGREHKTALKIKNFLKQQNPDSVTEKVGGQGLIATYGGNQEGPSVMIRCELDALPIPEENDAAYHSRTKGISHKCGHDGHMAIVSGLAAYLSKIRPERGQVHLLFQPAEETGEGAERVLSDQKFQSLAPDYVFALHNLPGYPKNQVIIKKGVFASASRGLVVRLKGETSHAAHPEKGRSPALALAQLIQTFSSFPQFFTSLDKGAKVTVVHSRLGEIAFGTSPGDAELRATIRTHKNSVMEQLCEKAEQVVKDTANTHGLEWSTKWTEIFEATVNDEDCNEMIQQAAAQAGKQVNIKKTPFAWSEDFGRFTSHYKGAMFGLGAGRDRPPLHSANYDFPDALIPAGTGMFLGIIDQVSGL